MVEEDKPMLVREVADFFQVTPYTIRLWLRDPDNPLQGAKIGKSWYVSRKSVNETANMMYGEVDR